MRRIRLFGFLGAVLVLVGGCTRPDPTLDTGQPLVVKWRLPLQVPAPPPGRGWILDDEGLGLIGEGAGLARIDPHLGIGLWSLPLPPTYALTATHGAHSALVTGQRDEVLLLGGGSGPGGGDPTAVEAVSAGTGEILWQRPLPSYSQVLGGGGLADGGPVVVARCLTGHCELTGYDGATGRQRWRRTIAGASAALSPAQPAVFVAGPRTITMLDTDHGGVHWTVARPPSAGLRLIPTRYELTLFVPPAPPSCAATLEFVGAGKIVANDTVPWHDEGAFGRPCTYDPDRVFLSASHMEVPVVGARVVVDVYSGQVFRFPLDPGEYLLCDCLDELTWTPGIGYRSRSLPFLDRKTPAVAPPAGPPAAREAEGTDGWLLRSGPGLVLWAPVYHAVKWQWPAVVPVLLSGGTLVYQDGSTLIGLGRKDPTRP